MHVLRLQSSDTFWVFFNEWNQCGACVVAAPVAFISFFFYFGWLWHQYKPRSRLSIRFLIFVGTIQYSLFMYIATITDTIHSNFFYTVHRNTMNMHVSCGQSLIGRTENRQRQSSCLHCRCFNENLSSQQGPPSKPFDGVIVSRLWKLCNKSWNKVLISINLKLPHAILNCQCIYSTLLNQLK